MILSVSRRTDIPAFYSDWFMNRLREGFVYVRNPMNYKQVSNVVLNPEVVDCIVFWTKNPEKLMNHLDEIDQMGYQYYFQFTITPYNHSIEPSLPPKARIIETFKRLSNKIGKEKVVWRYDPIILNEELTIEHHVRSFAEMVASLSEFTTDCIIGLAERVYQWLQGANPKSANSGHGRYGGYWSAES